MGYLNEDGLATLVGKVKGQVVQLTSAEYRNLPASKNSDNKTYFVTDEDYAYAIDDEPTLNSDNLVKSGGVYTYTSKIGSGTLTTTAQTIIPAINELKAGLTRHFLEFDATNITTTSGTIQSSSIVRITYNNHNISIDYYIRLASSTGRPTITINGFPTLPTNITSTGFPTHARVGTTNYITDSHYLRYTAGTTYATLTFYNYLGEFPAGNGYLVVSGNMSCNY